MTVLNIILLLLVIIFAGTTLLFFSKKNNTDNSKSLEEDLEKQKLAFLEKEENLMNNLNEAKEKITLLQQQLDGAIEGNLDDVIKAKLAEVAKLKKKISDVEEELENVEDERDKYKRRFNEKNDECLKLTDEGREKEKLISALNEDLDKIKADLEDKAQLLNLNTESLSFVQEVLSASHTNDDSTKQLYENVNRVVDFVNEELRDSFKEYIKTDEEKSLFDKECGDLARWAITNKKSWIKGKTSIAFVGEFSAGKTSIVNRILSQDNQDVPKLPVSMKATTAIPTYISGGVGTFYRFVTPDNLLKNISEETFKRVNKEVMDQVKGVNSLIQYFVMTYKNPNLDGLSILDTPGFSSNDKEDANRTLEVINECDALFWVFDVNNGTINRRSIELIKTNLKKPLYVIINKVDTKAETEVNLVEQIIRKTLRDEGVDVQKILRFSEKAPLESIMNPIKEVATTAEKDLYVDKMTAFLEVCIKNAEGNAKSKASKYNEAMNKSNNITDSYNNSIGRMEDNCNTAKGVPQWTTHIFSKDRFEMTPEQYNRLANLLDTICTSRVDELCNLYNKQMDASQELQQAFSNKTIANIKFNDLRKKLSTFNRLVGEINNL